MRSEATEPLRSHGGLSLLGRLSSQTARECELQTEFIFHKTAEALTALLGAGKGHLLAWDRADATLSLNVARVWQTENAKQIIVTDLFLTWVLLPLLALFGHIPAYCAGGLTLLLAAVGLTAGTAGTALASLSRLLSGPAGGRRGRGCKATYR